MQTCSSSTNQSSIEFISYTNGSDPFVSSDIIIDSDMTKYLLYSVSGAGVNVHMAKINPNGTTEWSKKYNGLNINHKAKRMVLSSDRNTIRMLADHSPNN